MQDVGVLVFTSSLRCWGDKCLQVISRCPASACREGFRKKAVLIPSDTKSERGGGGELQSLITNKISKTAGYSLQRGEKQLKNNEQDPKLITQKDGLPFFIET